ncbi:MAG: hypothetical protein QOE45_1546 [Frankiaceae bacterium]|jgi:hypothetical protein|nr:hypothetical protein [Frankiaceae bacterium]
MTRLFEELRWGVWSLVAALSLAVVAGMVGVIFLGPAGAQAGAVGGALLLAHWSRIRRPGRLAENAQRRHAQPAADAQGEDRDLRRRYLGAGIAVAVACLVIACVVMLASH